MIFSTLTSNNDAYTLKEMIKLKNILLFLEAMDSEVAEHESRDYWKVIEQSTLPKVPKQFSAH